MTISIDTGPLHPTTEACLKALQRLETEHDFSNILEIGCGSGILSLTAASIWDAQVLAADISQQAVDDTAEHIAEYDMETRVEVVRSDGFSHPKIREKAPYDLIMCNLLADTLLRLAHDLKNHLSPGGFCLLSGILAWRTQELEATFHSLAIDIIEKNQYLSWQSYILCNKSKT